MFAAFITLLLLLTLGYAALMAYYASGFKKLQEPKVTATNYLPQGISIIVPARNEATNIKACIDSILLQAYQGPYELIVINDHSTDSTLQIIQQYNTEITVINLEEHISNEPIIAYKKKAISIAITQAKYPIIITTDADTTRGKHWLSTIASVVIKDTHKIYAAPVDYVLTNSWFNWFQCIDFATMQGATAAGLHYNTSSTCNGANLVFSKKVFAAVNGYAGVDHIASGDDVLFMHKVQQRYPFGATYIKHPAATVYTNATPTLATFIQQRIRWGGKSKHLADGKTKAALALIFIYNICLIIATILLFTGKMHWLPFMFFAGIKIGFESMLVHPMLTFFNKNKLRIAHILMQPLHVIYIVIAAVLSLFNTTSWKGRKIG